MERGLSLIEPEDFKVIAGRGVSGTVSGHRIWLATRIVRVLHRLSTGGGRGSRVYIAADGRVLGVIILADRVRPDAKTALERLKGQWCETGDHAHWRQHGDGAVSRSGKWN